MRAYNLLAPAAWHLVVHEHADVLLLGHAFYPIWQNPKIKILNATVLLLIMLLWGQVATIDRSVFLYYLMYVLGLYCTPQLVKNLTDTSAYYRSVWLYGYV